MFPRGCTCIINGDAELKFNLKDNYKQNEVVLFYYFVLIKCGLKVS